MRRALIALALGVVLLLGTMAPAQAAPQFGKRFTARHGWVVWADNDRGYTITTRCHWYAGYQGWHTNWHINPGGFAWTTSDAGSWGNKVPRNLRCSYA